MQKTRDFKVDFWKFVWGIAHRPLSLMERGYGTPSQTYPSARFAPPANRLEPWVPPSALPGNKADLWMHCLILWSGAVAPPLALQCPKFVFTLGSSRHSPDPLVSWGGGYPLHTSISAPLALSRISTSESWQPYSLLTNYKYKDTARYLSFIMLLGTPFYLTHCLTAHSLSGIWKMSCGVLRSLDGPFCGVWIGVPRYSTASCSGSRCPVLVCGFPADRYVRQWGKSIPWLHDPWHNDSDSTKRWLQIHDSFDWR